VTEWIKGDDYYIERADGQFRIARSNTPDGTVAYVLFRKDAGGWRGVALYREIPAHDEALRAKTIKDLQAESEAMIPSAPPAPTPAVTDDA
jgi:hypothetical protein